MDSGVSLPRRKIVRLPDYDYRQCGAYFVTLCTENRAEILSAIGRGGALLRPVGRIAEQLLLDLPQHYPVQIDKYVVMPNHLHCILRITVPSSAVSLSGIVCAYKSLTTKAANQAMQTPGRKLWQRSYYEHIIRDEPDYQGIWQYIDENPQKWEIDRFYGKGAR